MVECDGYFIHLAHLTVPSLSLTAMPSSLCHPSLSQLCPPHYVIPLSHSYALLTVSSLSLTAMPSSLCHPSLSQLCPPHYVIPLPHSYALLTMSSLSLTAMPSSLCHLSLTAMPSSLCHPSPSQLCPPHCVIPLPHSYALLTVSSLPHSYAKIHIPIIASVSEHQPTTWTSFFFDLHILLCLFPAGVWFVMKKLTDERVFGTLCERGEGEVHDIRREGFGL